MNFIKINAVLRIVASFFLLMPLYMPGWFSSLFPDIAEYVYHSTIYDRQMEILFAIAAIYLSWWQIGTTLGRISKFWDEIEKKEKHYLGYLIFNQIGFMSILILVGVILSLVFIGTLSSFAGTPFKKIVLVVIIVSYARAFLLDRSLRNVRRKIFAEIEKKKTAV